MNTTPHMTEMELGLFIRQHLNTTSSSLPAPTLSRIQDARQAALARHAKLHTQPSLILAGHQVLAWGRDNIRPLVLALGLISALFASNYLMSIQHVNELEDVDSALLADDLPIDAYLDKGFDTWLSSAQHKQP